MKEQLKIETPSSAKATEGKKEKRLKYEIELEQRPDPLEGEAFDVWLKRIGGPNVQLLESLEKYKAPASKEKTPLIINKNGTFMLNNENVSTYFNREKLNAELEKKNPNVRFIKISGEYWLKKELFKNPELYFRVVSEELRSNRQIVADKRFGKSLEKWTEKSEAKEKVEKKKPLTLNEQIEQKRKELEESEREYNIYYRPVGWFHKKPVVRDLGYYANEAKLNKLKEELKGLEKESERETKRVAKKEKKEKKTVVAAGGGGGIITGEPEGLPEEVIEPSYEEQFEAIQERLKELPIEIRKSSVLGRSKLEKEQKKLRKRLKKLKKK